jgi:hypothetical protein
MQEFEEVKLSRKHLNKVMSGRLTTPSPPATAVPPLKFAAMMRPQPPAPRAAVSERSRGKLDAPGQSTGGNMNVRNNDKTVAGVTMGAHSAHNTNQSASISRPNSGGYDVLLMHGASNVSGVIGAPSALLPPLPVLPTVGVPSARRKQHGSLTAR